MNAKLKSLFLMFAFAAVLVFASCEKDLYEDNITHSNRQKLEFVTGDAARILTSKLKATLRKKYSVNDAVAGRISMSSIGIIQFDEIVKITDSLGNSTTTFKVDHPESSLTKFFNLTFQERAGGNVVKLMEYVMTPEFADEFAQTHDYKGFRGTVSTYTIVNETPCPDDDIVVAIGNVPPSPPGGGYIPPSGGTPPSTPPYTPPSPPTTPPPGPPPGPTTPPNTNPPNPGNGSSGSGNGAANMSLVMQIVDCMIQGGTWDIEEESCIVNPRYFRIGVPPTVDPGVEPCNPTVQVVIITPNTPCERSFMFNASEHLNWLFANSGTEAYGQIMAIVNGDYTENCSPEREALAKELIREIKRGSKIDFENKIIVDSTFVNNQKAMCVYNKLKNNNAFNEALTPFNMQNPAAFIKLTAGPIDNNPKGMTDPPDANNVIQITINNNPVHPNGINQRPNAMLAQTIIHEVMHAEIFRRVKIAIGNGSFTTITYNQLIYALQHSDYEDIVEYIRTSNDWSHDYMADMFRGIIARVTQEFVTGIPVTTPEQLYLDLAWSGLNSPDFNAWMALSQPDRTAINQQISSYNATHANETCQ